VTATASARERGSDPDALATLTAIERRVLWLAVRIVDYANRERPKEDALKVGGHQASSASMVSLMTALYFLDLSAEDRVAVKPHASPVLHAIEYLLGRLDRSYLTRLRDFGGLQSYPSRTKDPYPVDYSTGSVGLGSSAPSSGRSPIATSAPTSARRRAAGTSRCSATPSSTRATSGRRSATRTCARSGTSSGSST
jgi:pyruvate dehydrogenase E1 component